MSDKDLCHSVICIWHPGKQRYMFAVLYGLAFGESVAVWCFNRFPALLCAIARRWLSIPVTSFFDDFKVHDVAMGGGSSTMLFDRLCRER